VTRRHHRDRRSPRRLGPVLVALAMTGCSAEGLAFEVDDRIEFVAPKDRQRVRLPVELRWESEFPPPSSGGPYFVVFLDREPMRPGHTISTVLDDACRRDPSCPDVRYLEERGIYLRDTATVALETIPDRSTGTRTGAKEGHEAILVLVDRDGRRIDEAAWTRRFTLERDQ
jgi:hypothetical protein